jgi:hypothetical protein
MKDSSVFNPLDEYLKGIKQRPTTSFYPSSASCWVSKTELVGECLRKQYFRWKRQEGEESSSYRTWMAAQLGNAYEKAFLQGYKAQGLLKAEQYPFYRVIMGLPISGRLDGLTKKGEIIECKSVYGKAFYIKLSSSVMNRPKLEHLCQIMVYLAALGLNVCILPYGSRDDTGRRQGYRITKRDIEREGILFIKIIQRWKILQSHLIASILPDRDYDYDDWQCRYCSFRKLCYHQPKNLELL